MSNVFKEYYKKEREKKIEFLRDYCKKEFLEVAGVPGKIIIIRFNDFEHVKTVAEELKLQTCEFVSVTSLDRNFDFIKRKGVTYPFLIKDILKESNEYRVASLSEFDVDKLEQYPDNEKEIICKLMRDEPGNVIVRDTRKQENGQLTYCGQLEEEFIEYCLEGVRHSIGCFYEINH